MSLRKAYKLTGSFLLILCFAALVGCGGTKVYTMDKTMTYRDALYNLSSVQKITGREEARLEDGSVVNLRSKEKNELERFFKENPGVMVSMIVELGQEEMVYLRMEVDDYREYSRMKSRFDGALDDIVDFMGDKKKTQLKLK